METALPIDQNVLETVPKEEAGKDVWHVAAHGIKTVSNVYQRILAISNKFANKTDVGESAHSRLSGTAYKAKTYNAMLGGLKDVDDDHVIKIITDKDKSFKEKIAETAGYVKDKFDHQATAATILYTGKKAAFYALGVGVAFAVSTFAPAVVAAGAGYMAYKGGKKGAEWYLSTGQGHAFEAKAGNLIKKGIDAVSNGINFFKGSRRAAKGLDQEYNAAADLHQELETAAKHDHSHDHEGHGHDDHHHHHSHNLLHDIRDVALSGVHALMNPKQTVLGISERIAGFCNTLYEACHDATSNKMQNTIKLDTMKENAMEMAMVFEMPKAKWEMSLKK